MDYYFTLGLNGIRGIAPRPEQHAPLVWQVHEEFGHFGVHRTHLILRIQYWWIGMYQ